MKILFGIRPTSKSIHIGHISILKELSKFVNENSNLSDSFDIYIFIAHYHALTTGLDIEKSERYKNFSEYGYFLFTQAVKTIKYYLDDEVKNKVNIIMIPQYRNFKILDTFVKLLNITSYSEITSIPTLKEYKKNLKKNEYLSAGFINYPILQAADIISINPDYIFVGKDQLPNLKILKKLIRKYNSVYNEKVNEDIKIIATENVIPGYDGRKMSKSYNNVINIDDEDVVVKDKISIYPTDGHRKGEKGDFNKCMFYHLCKGILKDNTVKEIENYCSNNNSLCKICKEKFGEEIFYLIDSLR